MDCGKGAIDIAPNLVKLVSKRVRSRLTVRQGLDNRAWTRGITGSMSIAQIAEFLDLWQATAHTELRAQPDRTIWRWTPDGRYTATSSYRMMHEGAVPFRGHKLIWKTWAPMKVKVFLWLSFRRRHWTNDRRARHGLEARTECYLCDQAAETIDHILSTCPFTREVWHHLCEALGRPLPAARPPVLAWWASLRSSWQGNSRKGFDSLFALTSWTIWKERNARCFRESATTIPELLTMIKAEAEQWANAGAKNLWSLASGVASCHLFFIVSFGLPG